MTTAAMTRHDKSSTSFGNFPVNIANCSVAYSINHLPSLPEDSFFHRFWNHQCYRFIQISKLTRLSKLYYLSFAILSAFHYSYSFIHRKSTSSFISLLSTLTENDSVQAWKRQSPPNTTTTYYYSLKILKRTQKESLFHGPECKRLIPIKVPIWS